MRQVEWDGDGHCLAQRRAELKPVASHCLYGWQGEPGGWEEVELCPAARHIWSEYTCVGHFLLKQHWLCLLCMPVLLPSFVPWLLLGASFPPPLLLPPLWLSLSAAWSIVIIVQNWSLPLLATRQGKHHAVQMNSFCRPDPACGSYVWHPWFT